LPQSPTTIPPGDVFPPPIARNFNGINTVGDGVTPGTNVEAALYGGVNGAIGGPITVGQLAYISSIGGSGSSITANRAYLSGTAYVEGGSISGPVTLTSGGVLARVRGFGLGCV
jgi:hypothetical protein